MYFCSHSPQKLYKIFSKTVLLLSMRTSSELSYVILFIDVNAFFVFLLREDMQSSILFILFYLI